MRTRDKTLKDYGVPEDKIKSVYAACQDRGNLSTLAKAVSDTVPYGIQDAILRGLKDGLGYAGICSQMGSILCGRKDFYGYKRKAAAKFYEIMGGKI